MSVPRFNNYNASGTDWLGELPPNWDVLLGRRLFQQIREAAREDDEQLSATQRYGVVPQKLFMELEDQKVVLALGGLGNFKHVEKDDFVISLRSFQGGIEHSAHSGCVSPAYTVLRARNEISASYYAYTFKSSAFVSALQTTTDGIRDGKNISYDQFGSVSLPLPPLPEQTAIATFLDRETAKIDALVQEQRRLIDLLKEKRQAVVSRAVTKGLNPDAPMKDTGIEWLGEMPKHWDRVQLGRLCLQVSDGPHFSPDYVDDGVMFLSARNIKLDGWSLEDAKFVSEEDCAAFDRRVLPEKGDVLYTKGGTTGIARVVDLDHRFQVWVHVAVLKVNHCLVDPHYLAYALNSTGCYEQSQLYTQGATNKDLGLTRLIRIWLALPPLAEQREVVGYLEQQTFRMNELIREAEKAIGLLLERRAALISAAVTGGIDVRGLATGSEAA